VLELKKQMGDDLPLTHFTSQTLKVLELKKQMGDDLPLTHFTSQTLKVLELKKQMGDDLPLTHFTSQTLKTKPWMLNRPSDDAGDSVSDIVVAMGSGGSAAGIALGVKLAGLSKH
jgi:hypothetical protein